MKQWIPSLIVLTLSILTACGGASSEPVASPTPAATATDTPTVVVDTPTPEPTMTMVEQTAKQDEMAGTIEPDTTVEPTIDMAATADMVETPEIASEAASEMMETPEMEPEAVPQAEVDWLTVEGKTDEGFTYLGNPDASVTIIDYSDFL